MQQESGTDAGCRHLAQGTQGAPHLLADGAPALRVFEHLLARHTAPGVLAQPLEEQRAGGTPRVFTCLVTTDTGAVRRLHYGPHLTKQQAIASY